MHITETLLEKLKSTSLCSSMFNEDQRVQPRPETVAPWSHRDPKEALSSPRFHVRKCMTAASLAAGREQWQKGQRVHKPSFKENVLVVTHFHFHIFDGSE